MARQRCGAVRCDADAVDKLIARVPTAQAANHAASHAQSRTGGGAPMIESVWPPAPAQHRVAEGGPMLMAATA